MSFLPCSYGLLYTSSPANFTNVRRNVNNDNAQSYSQYYTLSWYGEVYSGETIRNVSAGEYRIRYSALKHFGNVENPNDFEVYRSPIFNLIY